jgi:hypothetical protein
MPSILSSTYFHELAVDVDYTAYPASRNPVVLFSEIDGTNIN